MVYLLWQQQEHLFTTFDAHNLIPRPLSSFITSIPFQLWVQITESKLSILCFHNVVTTEFTVQTSKCNLNMVTWVTWYECDGVVQLDTPQVIQDSDRSSVTS